jgi:hypothetical protein
MIITYFLSHCKMLLVGQNFFNTGSMAVDLRPDFLLTETKTAYMCSCKSYWSLSLHFFELVWMWRFFPRRHSNLKLGRSNFTIELHSGGKSSLKKITSSKKCRLSDQYAQLQ